MVGDGFNLHQGLKTGELPTKPYLLLLTSVCPPGVVAVIKYGCLCMGCGRKTAERASPIPFSTPRDTLFTTHLVKILGSMEGHKSRSMVAYAWGVRETLRNDSSLPFTTLFTIFL